MSWLDKLSGKKKKVAKKIAKNPNNKSRVVTLRVMMAMFGGGTIEGLATEAGVSERTVFRVIEAAKLAGFKVTRTKTGIFRAFGKTAARNRKAGGE